MGRENTLKGNGKHTAAIILGAVLLFYLIVNLWYLSTDHTALRDASGTNYIHAMRLLKGWQHESPAQKAARLYMDTPDNLGPVYMAPFTLLMAAGVTSADDLALLNFAFLALLTVALYGLGKEIFDESTALLAAALVMFFPPIVSLSRSLEGRLSLAAFVTLALWALVKSRRFSSLRYSLLFGILLGLTALTKVEFSFFFAIPLLAEAIPAVTPLFHRQDRPPFRSLRHLALALLIAAAVALPWYLAHLGNYLSWHTGALARIGNPDAGIQMLRHIDAAVLLARDVLSPAAFALFLLGGTLFLFRGQKRTFLFGWAVIPFTAFFLINGRDAGCITSGDGFAALLPAVALITARGLLIGLGECLPPRVLEKWKRRTRYVSLALILLAEVYFLIGMTLSTSGGVPGLRGERFLAWIRSGCYESKPLTCGADLDFCIETDPLSNRAPSTFDYDFNSLPETLARMGNGNAEVKVFSFYETYTFSGAASYLLKKADLSEDNASFTLDYCQDFVGYASGNQKTPEECAEAVSAADVLIFERTAPEHLCRSSPHLVAALESLVPALKARLSEYDPVYIVRIVPSEDLMRPPASKIYLQDAANRVISWEERGIREPIEELLGVVLVRQPSSQEPTEEDAALMERWLFPGCKQQGGE